MAYEKTVQLLKKGWTVWNPWRETNDSQVLDIRALWGADLAGADLRKTDLHEAWLTDANLQGAALGETDLHEARLMGADMRGARLDGANLRKANMDKADLRGATLENGDLEGVSLQDANLTKANLSAANLQRANLKGAQLEDANLEGANLSDADLSGARLERAQLGGARLIGARLRGAYLSDANAREADFTQASLSEAHLQGAKLLGAVFFNASLEGAVLERAHLQGANFFCASLRSANLRDSLLYQASLLQTDLENAVLTGCCVWGAAVWNVGGTPKDQTGLIITHDREPTITVDDLEVAQFIYLLVKRHKLRNVISTLTSKAVLILGRFTPERKSVLDAIATELRKYNLLPIIFDFERAASRDFTETIKLLAALSLFVIADITNPKSAPLELQATVPDYKIPFVLLIEQGEKPFSMFTDLGGYDWVLPPVAYPSTERLLQVFKSAIIDRAWSKHQELQKKKATTIETLSVDDFIRNGSKTFEPPETSR